MENIHSRIMITVNTSLNGNTVMLISEKARNGEFVVCNELNNEEAISMYKKLTGMEDAK